MATYAVQVFTAVLHCGHAVHSHDSFTQLCPCFGFKRVGEGRLAWKEYRHRVSNERLGKT